jgi:endonuclease YncB( thermonuclease family)
MDIPINWDLVNNDVKEFGFEGETKTSKVVNVYDGDTIKVVFQVMRKLYKFNCRISGVDTPEIRTRNLKEKELGLKVRDELRKKILNKIVKIKCGEFDKYGRLLIEVITNDNEKIKDWLINNDYAFSYDGGTKKKWSVYLNTISAAQELANNIKEDEQEKNKDNVEI